jgi:TPP-dependent indolepyruvate ferredoxin oxidoreductase alpha subunit
VIEAHPRRIGDMAAVLRREIEHHGPSVVIATRECIEAAKRRKALAR